MLLLAVIMQRYSVRHWCHGLARLGAAETLGLECFDQLNPVVYFETPVLAKTGLAEFGPTAVLRQVRLRERIHTLSEEPGHGGEA